MGARTFLACAAADAARWGLSRVLHRGGGNAPGAIALKLNPNIIADLAADLDGSIVVTGTNGKTTTNGLIADGLAAAGYDVVCNRAGKNMQTGIAAAMVAGRRDLAGKKGRFGAFECDELYTVRVLPQVKPRALVLLNLFRDQLDRYGEIDHTQDVIAEALRLSPQTTLIYNADDPLCAAIAARVDNTSIGFGIDEPTGLEADRISDSRFCALCNAPLDYEYVHYGQLGKYRCPKCGWSRPELGFAARDVELSCGKDGGYSWDVCGPDGFKRHVKTHYNGLYMVFNITAVVAALVIIPACFSYKLDVGAGPGLLFVTLPTILQDIPLGRLFAVILYLAMIFAGVSSLQNMFEVVAESLQHRFPRLSRGAVLAGLAVICLGFGIGMEPIYSWGPWMDFVSIYIIPIGATIGAVTWFYVMKKDELLNAVNLGSKRSHGKLWYGVGRYVYVPIAIILCAVALIMGISF